MEAKPVRRIALYHSLPGEPRSDYMRVAEISISSSGQAELYYVVDEANIHSELDRILSSVGLRSLDRRVTPEEGTLFLDAVQESLARDSYWRVVDESVNGCQALLTEATQLATDASLLADLSVATGVAHPLVDRLRAHSQAANHLRDSIHARLLTDSDIAKRATPRKDR